MTNEYIERDCTIEHKGQTFTANGALVNDAYLIAYPSDKSVTGLCIRNGSQPGAFVFMRNEKELHDWHGNVIGTWYTVSTRKAVFFGYPSWQGDKYYYMRARLTDGREYALRGFGVGMVAKGKRVKTSK